MPINRTGEDAVGETEREGRPGRPSEDEPREDRTVEKGGAGPMGTGDNEPGEPGPMGTEDEHEEEAGSRVGEEED